MTENGHSREWPFSVGLNETGVSYRQLTT